MSETCKPHHDWFTAVLTAGLCLGLVLSYVPQHLRIYLKKSSEGFSPWFLLLGSTSAASGMLNMIALQWQIIKCCRFLSTGNCLESIGGVFQVFLQWFMFTCILVLYMVYFPSHLKYAEIDIDSPQHHHMHVKTRLRTDEWRLSITLSWVVLIHILLITFTTFFLLLTSTAEDSHQVHSWATFLGVTSALLSAIQYAPQISRTYHAKVVGALSIPMMMIQSPGAVLMVLSIALRPDTNWTSWITFAVAGVMQGSLLIMCIVWKVRQHRLHIDDFGHPLPHSEDQDQDVEATSSSAGDTSTGYAVTADEDANEAAESTPLLVKNTNAADGSERRGLARFLPGWLTGAS
ncbi:hypothetical protein PLICRDRAFT_38295 [Plicaturopsis crispa FD-325 SS-3]|nr:hypothetical protein PLICRDRAFT_38295 [Plicaturopsis crispa FD-325 SS-3]